MKTRLLNSYEEVTYDKLRAVCDPVGAHVFPKVRIADVFRLDASGLKAGQYSYALRAHFDFVVTDADYKPIFSVEYDGPLHRINAGQSFRDRLKEAICDHFRHSLLRINSRYLSKEYRGLNLLTYFVNVWFLEGAFDEAQQKGLISYDEPFDPTFIYSNGTPGGRKWPYWLSVDLQASIQRLHMAGRIAQMAPSHFVGVDHEGNYRCISWLAVTSEQILRVTTGMRPQRFPAASESELISMVAIFDLNERLKEALDGNLRLTVTKENFLLELRSFREKYAMRSMITCGEIE
jgi:hypothetical protein